MNPTEAVSSLNDSNSRLVTEIMLHAMREIEKPLCTVVAVASHRDVPVMDYNGTNLPITVDDIIQGIASQIGETFRGVIEEHLLGEKQ